LALSLGAERFIVKPTEPDVFVGMLREVIREAEAGRLVAPREPVGEEAVYFREYNEALIRKLEDKMLQLEETNRALERELTERKRVEGALRESEEEHRLLVENATVAIIVAQDGMLKLFNPKAMEIAGYSQEELASKPFVELIHPDDREMAIKYYLKRLKGEESPVIYTLRIIDKGGSLKWLESNAILITWEGRPATLSFLNDITERERAEELLELERRRLSMLLEMFPGYIYLQAPDYSVRYANQYFVEHFGEPKGRLCYEVLWGRKEPCEVCPTFEVFDTKTPQVWEWSQTPDGRIYAIYDHPFVDSDGSELVLEIGVDITERKRVEETKDNLIRDVSHELKTPLAKMQMSVEMLTETVGAPSIDRQKVARASEMVAGNAQRLRHTVNSILDLSSLESGRTPYHKTKVQPEKLVGQAILDMRPLAEAKGLELVAELPEGLPQVEGDREKLFHVLTNLVDNAVKFNDQGKIVISAKEKAHEVEIAVSDSGRGILRENLERVFERFYQESPSIPGAGIGLAICKTIVEAHGGMIWAESAGRDQGTIVRFTLPM
jgi:PAS domain S-box-containing protein